MATGPFVDESKSNDTKYYSTALPNNESLLTRGVGGFVALVGRGGGEKSGTLDHNEGLQHTETDTQTDDTFTTSLTDTQTDSNSCTQHRHPFPAIATPSSLVNKHTPFFLLSISPVTIQWSQDTRNTFMQQFYPQTLPLMVT